MTANCVFPNHPPHLEINFVQLRQALIDATWPATPNLIPPGSLDRNETWRDFYAERIQLGLISIYPRQLSQPMTSMPLIPALPYPLLEILLVPHWSHRTDLRQGVRTRQQRLATIAYACCELAFLHQTVADLWPVQPPLLYAITHQRPGDLFRWVGYACAELPLSLTEIYRPAIERLVWRDDPHQAGVKGFIMAHTRPDAGDLRQIGERLVTCGERAAGLIS